MRRPATIACAAIVVLVATGSLACSAAGVSPKSIKLSRTHCDLGRDLMAKKRPFQAKKELFKSLEYDTTNEEAHHLLGVLFFVEGMHKDNLVDRVHCLRGVEADEQRTEANTAFRSSEKHFQSSLKTAELNNRVESTTLVYLANIALHFKRYSQAIVLCRKALSNAIYSARHLALGVMGWAYFLKGDLRHAAKELRQAVYHEPRFHLGRYRLAKVYFKDNKTSKTIKELEHISRDGKYPLQEVPYLLAQAYTKAGNLDRARGQFELCVQKNPQSCLAQTCRRMVKDATRNSDPVAE